MKKNRRLFLLSILMISIGLGELNAQALACNDYTQFTLDADGQLTIYPEDILEGGPYGDNLQVFIYTTNIGGDFLTLNCDDIGSLFIEVRDNDTGNTCWGEVVVEDKLRPIPYVTVGAIISLYGGNSVSLDPEVIDVGSYDNCSITSMTVEPSEFTSPGDYEVTLKLEDQSGNKDEAYTYITVIEGEITCNEQLNVALDLNGGATLNSDVFLEGNGKYDMVEISLDNVNFTEELTFNCDVQGTPLTVYTRVTQDGEVVNCTTELLVEDKLPPIVVANDFTIDLDSQNDTYTLEVEDIDNGSYDNCGSVALELSKMEFDASDWGETQVFLEGTDESGLQNSAFSIVTVLIDGEAASFECKALTLELTNPKPDDVSIWVNDFLEESGEYENFGVSFDPDGPFELNVIAPCVPVGKVDFPVYIRGFKDGLEEICSTTLSIEDKAVPIPILKQNIILNLEDGSATLLPEMVDNGSRDNCSTVGLTFSKNTFTEEDAGDQEVTVIVSDENGNESRVLINVFVNDGSTCGLSAVIFPPDLAVSDGVEELGNLTVEKLQSDYGFTFEQVHPHTEIACPDIHYTYMDQVVIGLNIHEVIRTWTALDWQTSEVITYVQTITLYSDQNTLVCDSWSTFSVLNGPLQLTINDFLYFFPQNLTKYSMVITELDGNVVSNNIVTSEYIGDSLLYEITELSTGNTCWSYFTIVDEFTGCFVNDASISNPQSVIAIEGYSGQVTELTPEFLVEQYNYALDDVMMLWSEQDCEIASISYVDEVTDQGNGNFEIERTFTITDWVACYQAEESMWSFTQTIEVTATANELNCNQFLFMSLSGDGTAVAYADIFVEGNNDFDLIEVSLDNVNFGPSVSFDCEDASNTFIVYVHVEDDGNSYDCTSQILIEDKLAPSIIVVDFTINLESQTDTYNLQLDDVLESSFDNCPGLLHNLSQVEFSIDDWGQNPVVVTVTDAGNQSASATSTVTVLVDGQSSPLECISLSALAEPFGTTQIWATDFVVNSEDYDQILASLDPSGPFEESIEVGCGLNGNPGAQVYIQALSDGNLFECTNTISIIDETPPVAVVESSVFLYLINGEATLTPEMVDEGSYDHCTMVEFELSQTLFTTEDIGTNTVSLTVTDLNGNQNVGFTTVIVENGSGCNLGNIVFPNDIEINDEGGTTDNLSIQNLQDIYGYTFEEVHPYTQDICDGIAYAYEDLIVNFEFGFKVIRTWTAVDWYTTEILTHIQILKLNTSFITNIACKDTVIISIENGPVQVLPIDLLEGGPYNYDNMEVLILDGNGDFLVDNIIPIDDVVNQYIYEVSEVTTENMCWGLIIVEDSTSGCALEEENINYPLASIQIPDFDIDPTDVSPENLVENYGFELTDVTVTWPEEECLVVALSYEDEVFDYGGGNYMIVRKFTLIDWLTFEPGTSTGIWTFSQVINLGIEQESLICDFLPRTADIVDCDFGHTDEDDVEWPADLAIADYRITPEELVTYSMVDVLDSEPSFYNNPDDYEATYIDLLIDLEQTYLVVGRVWTVHHITYDFTWTYNQQITVDITDFSNLVTVNTGTERVMPGVVINDEFVTDMNGKTLVEGVSEVSATYEDDPLNGINVLDVIRIQRHILFGGDVLSDFALLAGDFNNDQAVKASDLTEMRKLILGITPEVSNAWRFYNNDLESNIGVEPKASLLGIKPGDVDDSAILTGQVEFEVDDQFEIKDLLLNNGETYEVPIYLENAYDIFGIDFRAQVDTNLIEITGIQTALGSVGSNFNVRDDGRLIAFATEVEAPINIGGSLTSPVITLEITAKANSLLSKAIDLEGIHSFLGDSNLELVVLGGEIGDMIGTGTNSPELSGLNVYPNPASDYLNFDFDNIGIDGEFAISIHSADGSKLQSGITNSRVDISNLPAGIYYYSVLMDRYSTNGKFIVVK